MVRLAVLGSGWSGSDGWVCTGIEVGIVTIPELDQLELWHGSPEYHDDECDECLQPWPCLTAKVAVYARELITRAEVAESIAERLDDGWLGNPSDKPVMVGAWSANEYDEPEMGAVICPPMVWKRGDETEPMTSAEAAWFEARRTSDTKGEA